MKDNIINLTDHQTRFLDSDAEYLAFVAGWGSGKTEAGILKIMELADETPNNLLLICRKEYTDLHDSTMKDFEKYTKLIIGSNKDVKLPNGSIIMFRHAGELDILKNVNLGGYMMEQAEEFETDTEWTYLNGRVRRDNVKHYGRIVIANTKGHNWLWRKFKASADNNGDTIRDLPHPVTDKLIKVKFHLEEGTTFICNSNHLPSEYIANLAICKADTPEIYNQFVMNSWTEGDTIHTVIPEAIIRQCIGLNGDTLTDNRKFIAYDIARMGDDRTVIGRFEGRLRMEERIIRQAKTTETTGHISRLADDNGIKFLTGDAIGVGAGPSDVLDDMKDDNNKDEQGNPMPKYNVHRIISSASPINKHKFYNIRDEMWWTVRELFQNKQIPMVVDEELICELSALRYKPDSKGRIKVESKEDMKKRLGKSPDKADMFVMAQYALQFVPFPEPEEIILKMSSLELKNYNRIKRQEEKGQEEYGEYDPVLGRI